jgi:mono/diheme cytochrome c family protein
MKKWKGIHMSKSGVTKSVLLMVFIAAATAISLADLKADKIERGRYLVQEVAQCGECHTPRDDHGQPDRSRWLQGAPVWFQPIHPVSTWAYSAPPLAGLGSLTKDQALQVLEKGLGPQANPVRQPMHRYHIAPEDAEAIVAYLQSLK